MTISARKRPSYTRTRCWKDSNGIARSNQFRLASFFRTMDSLRLINSSPDYPALATKRNNPVRRINGLAVHGQRPISWPAVHETRISNGVPLLSKVGSIGNLHSDRRNKHAADDDVSQPILASLVSPSHVGAGVRGSRQSLVIAQAASRGHRRALFDDGLAGSIAGAAILPRTRMEGDELGAARMLLVHIGRDLRTL